MDIDQKKRFSKIAYEPYFKRAGYCLERDILISIVLFLVTLVASFFYDDSGYVFSALFVLGIAIIWFGIIDFTPFFVILLEKKRYTWHTESLRIIKLSESFFVGINGEIVTKLYPKSFGVCTYKVKCVTDDGKTIMLRSIMSIKKAQIICDRIVNNQPTSVRISYGRYSKIIMFYHGTEFWIDKLNHFRV